MIYIKYVVFFLVAHLLLMQVFRFTTYHRYFWKALPVLVTYSGIVGWALFHLNLASFFIWHIVISSLFFANGAKKQRDLGAAMLALETEPASQAIVAISIKKTVRFYWLSAVTYLLVFSCSLLFFYNQYNQTGVAAK